MSEFPAQNTCTISRLPPEILSDILHQSLLEDASNPLGVQLETDWTLRRNVDWEGAGQRGTFRTTGHVPQLSLVLVCSAWRTLVYSTPILWTIFKAEFTREPKKEVLHRIHNSLARAKSLPLHIYITAHDVHIHENSSMLMEILSPFLAQIQFMALNMSFHLVMSVLGSTALNSGLLALPLLEELRIGEALRWRSEGGDPDTPWKQQLSDSQETFFVHRSPRLRRLFMTSPGPGYLQRAIRNTILGIPLGQLTLIHVKRWHLSTTLQLFQFCPNLVDFHITTMAGSSNITSRSTMHFLERFSCETATTPLPLLARVSLPAIKSLRLAQPFDTIRYTRNASEGTLAKGLISLYHCDPFRLQHLDISGLEFLGHNGSNRSKAIEFLSLIPTLVELRLEEGILLDREFMEALTHDPANSSACLLPNLKTIYLAYSECERETVDQGFGQRKDIARNEWMDSGWLLDMIESRWWDGSAPHGEVVARLDRAEFRMYDCARPKQVWFQRVSSLRAHGMRVDAAWIRGMEFDVKTIGNLQQMSYTPNSPPGSDEPSWDDIND